MFIKINPKRNITIFILFLAIFLPSCVTRDLYNAHQDYQESKEEEKEERIREEEDEGKSIIFEFLKKQAHHYDTNGVFVDDINELNIDSSSFYYDVEITKMDSNTGIIITATAREDGLRSFSGISDTIVYFDRTELNRHPIEYYFSSGELEYIKTDLTYKFYLYSQMCQTISPATSIQLPLEEEICGSDSEKIMTRF